MGGLFEVAKVKALLAFRAQYAAQHNNTAFTNAFKKQQPNLANEWEAVVKFLAQDRFHLGFIGLVQQDGQDWLQIETAYLDYIVGPASDRYLLQNGLKELDTTQRKQLGLQLTPYKLASLLPAKINKPNDLQQLLKRLKALDLVPDLIGWNQIIHRCHGLPMAQQALQECKKRGVMPNVFTFSSLLDKAANLEQGQQILQLMREAHLRPDKITYTSLFKQTKTWQEIEQVWQSMQADGVQFNRFHFNVVRNKLQRAMHQQADQLLEEFSGLAQKS